MASLNPFRISLITDFSWGKIVLNDHRQYKDAKISYKSSINWDWSEYGTSHGTGINKKDTDWLIGEGCTCIILTTGVHDRISHNSETHMYLKQFGIEVREMNSTTAYSIFNNLIRNGVKVGILLHSTC